MIVWTQYKKGGTRNSLVKFLLPVRKVPGIGNAQGQKMSCYTRVVHFGKAVVAHFSVDQGDDLVPIGW